MSLEYFVTRVKPACEKFLKSPNSDNLDEFQKSLKNFDNAQLDNFQSYILLPLVIKLDSLEER